jgi:hypothetical protein
MFSQPNPVHLQTADCTYKQQIVKDVSVIAGPCSGSLSSLSTYASIGLLKPQTLLAYPNQQVTRGFSREVLL